MRLVAVECGHGDTILIELPGEQWLLVDCNLPSVQDREKFFSVAKQFNIRALYGIVLSHPHADHYMGMRKLIKACIERKFKLGYFFWAGISVAKVAAILNHPNSSDIHRNEFISLARELKELNDTEVIYKKHLNQSTKPVIEKIDTSSSFTINPLGPNTNEMDTLDLEFLEKNKVPVAYLNRLSIILHLNISTAEGSYDVLLTGDADTPRLESALDGQDSRFDCVKIAHHGSSSSKCLKLTELNKREAVAFVSVGTKYPSHPAKAVIKAFMDKNWEVVSTRCKDNLSPVYDSPLDLVPSSVNTEARVQNIEIRFANNKFACYPDSCKIRHDELDLYK